MSGSAVVKKHVVVEGEVVACRPNTALLASGHVSANESRGLRSSIRIWGGFIVGYHYVKKRDLVFDPLSNITRPQSLRIA